MLHPNDGTPVRVKAGEISITPAAGFKSLGEVAMLNGSVVVTAKEGTLQVDDHGTTKNVAKGQTIVINPKTAQSKSGGAGWGGGNTALEAGALGAAGAAAILAGVAMSRAGDANTSAQGATAAANSATSAANTANSTAAAAASAASAAASAAAQAEFLAECANDWLQEGNYASVDQITGSTCPIYAPGTTSSSGSVVRGTAH